VNAARVLRGLVLGAIGGFLGWVLVETLRLSPDNAQTVRPDDWSVALFGAVIGLLDGVALGVGEGITAGTKPKFQRAVGFGALTGLLGGLLGLTVGQLFYQTMLTTAGIQSNGQSGFIPFLVQLIARSVGWGLIGTFVGAAIGVPSGSTRKIRHGLIGGAIGGLVGGFAFEIVGRITGAGGFVPRLIGLTSIGAAVGFFVSLVDEALKSAWVRILVGRNEGREVVIDKPVATVGRDELADVPLYGDPSVSRHHATILQQAGRYLIQDQGTPAGTLVNGQRVSQQPLQDGDEIQMGSARLIFYEKATAGPLRRPVDAPRSPMAPMPPTPANVCAFCGGVKDPVTGACDCAVGEPSPLGPDPFASAPSLWPADSGEGLAGSQGGPRLVAVAGPYVGQVFPIPASGGDIGREPARELALSADATVSRRHASLTPEAGAYLLRDEGSSNGTFVNGQRIQQHSLRAGDEIRIGASVFRFDA
jgi:pSer/pThr/pTyr-binding forkhead associated (FHA) protein